MALLFRHRPKAYCIVVYCQKDFGVDPRSTFLQTFVRIFTFLPLKPPAAWKMQDSWRCWGLLRRAVQKDRRGAWLPGGETHPPLQHVWASKHVMTIYISKYHTYKIYDGFWFWFLLRFNPIWKKMVFEITRIQLCIQTLHLPYCYAWYVLIHQPKRRFRGQKSVWYPTVWYKQWEPRTRFLLVYHHFFNWHGQFLWLNHDLKHTPTRNCDLKTQAKGNDQLLVFEDFDISQSLGICHGQAPNFFFLRIPRIPRCELVY